MFTWLKLFFPESWSLYQAATLSVESLVQRPVVLLLRAPGAEPWPRQLGTLPCGVLPSGVLPCGVLPRGLNPLAPLPDRNCETSSLVAPGSVSYTHLRAHA